MLGKDFFKWFGFVLNAVRMFVRIFGDEQDAKEVQESEERTGDGDNRNVC